MLLYGNIIRTKEYLISLELGVYLYEIFYTRGHTLIKSIWKQLIVPEVLLYMSSFYLFQRYVTGYLCSLFIQCLEEGEGLMKRHGNGNFMLSVHYARPFYVILPNCHRILFR